MKRALSILALVSLLLGGSILTAPIARPAGLRHWAEDAMSTHRQALWHIVHDLCEPSARAIGAPAPCTAVNLQAGFAVLKDIQGPTQYLIIPTARVSGIESPDLLQPDGPNYWRDAWRARRWLEKKVGRPVPRWGVGLAVNSQSGRSQDQLHIHLDCVRADVSDVLAKHQAAIGDRWSKLTVGPGHYRYRVRWIGGADSRRAQSVRHGGRQRSGGPRRHGPGDPGRDRRPAPGWQARLHSARRSSQPR